MGSTSVPHITLPAKVAFSDALKSMEEFVRQARGDEFSLLEASKLRAIADQIEQKVREEVGRRGIILDGNPPQKLDKPPATC